MPAETTHRVHRDSTQEPRRCYRVERRFASVRQAKELVHDLLQAHCGR
jgi:hypothetical protein